MSTGGKCSGEIQSVGEDERGCQGQVTVLYRVAGEGSFHKDLE